MALAILVATGLTVDLRFFDFPTVVVFLLAGVAVGCADRAPTGRAAVTRDTHQRMLLNHG